MWHTGGTVYHILVKNYNKMKPVILYNKIQHYFVEKTRLGIQSSATMKRNGTVTISVDVKNTGNRDGTEVAQLYMRDDFSSVTRPVKEL